MKRGYVVGGHAAPYWDDLTDVVNDIDTRIARIETAFRAYLEGATDNYAGRQAALTILNEKETS